MLTNQIETEMKTTSMEANNQDVSMTFENKNKNENENENERDSENDDDENESGSDDQDGNENENENKSNNHGNNHVSDRELVEFDNEVKVDFDDPNTHFDFDDYFQQLGNQIENDQQVQQIRKTMMQFVQYHVDMTKVKCSIANKTKRTKKNTN